MRWSPSDGMLEAGHAAGFAAIGREPAAGVTDRFRAAYLARFLEPGVLEEIEYPSAVWAPAHMLADTTHALLETLRDRGYRLALVSNAFDPPDLLHRDLATLGVADRLDTALFSSELGARKPDPMIFRE